MIQDIQLLQQKRRAKLRHKLKTGLLLDGGIGSLLLSRLGAGAEFNPEQCNLTHADIVKSVAADYFAAGSELVLSNTFGANPIKSPAIWAQSLAAAVAYVKQAAAECDAKDADGEKIARFVGLDVGPTGKIVGRDITLDQAVDCYKQVLLAGQAAGADCAIAETFTDIAELRAVLLAREESGCALPILCSMSFEHNGRSVFGTPVEAYAVTATALGADAVGVNCSLGPNEMLTMAQTLLQWTDKPVFVKPNAGLPVLTDGNAVYALSPRDFARDMEKFARLGVSILGGCCGTTPRHIAAICALPQLGFVSAQSDTQGFRQIRAQHQGAFSSALGVAVRPVILGERINPTGKPRLKQALKEGDFDYVVALGRQQIDQGAQLLDVNMGFNEIDEAHCMAQSVRALSASVATPLCLDSSDLTALTRALRAYPGRALVNSVNGSPSSLASVLPLCKKYGAAVVGLCLDEGGVPEIAEDRLSIGKRIVDAAAQLGIAPYDVYLDTLTMAQSAGRDNAPTTLRSLKFVQDTLGVKTVLGVSNVSFGMPNRADINAKFLQMATDAGLDLAIINPELFGKVGSEQAAAFLRGDDGATEAYLHYAATLSGATDIISSVHTNAVDAVSSLKEAIEQGSLAAAERVTQRLLQDTPPNQILEQYVIPALNCVGETYESGITFLPQLIASSEAAKAACALITQNLAASGHKTDGKRFILATVQGDVHDIGKNIVATVTANYGYEVIDLGRDVAVEKVVAAVKRHYPCVLGLSALMTTTAVNMKKTIQALRAESLDIPVLVGGAVLTKEYAAQIGGIYCRDATETVRQLKLLFADIKV